MTQENKDLLLKDLCARLPYGVWIERKLKSCKFGAKCMLNAHDISAIEREQYEFCKPYLFPLSSMTDEQMKEYLSTKHKITKSSGKFMYLDSTNTIDFYNKHHFDWRGLIPMDLANDATGKNIY